MNSEEIRHLLEKYYDGESTVKEEAFLKSFFSHGDIPEDLLDEKQIFCYYLKSAMVLEPSQDFEKKIIDSLDSVDKDSSILKRRRVFGTLTAIAAGLLILTGSYFFFTHKSEPRDTFSDPEIAYAETMKILYSVSIQMNNGTQALDRIGSMQEVTRQSLETINRSASTIQKKMKPLDHLRRARNIIDSTNDKN
jgi:hypothetical protein